MSFESGSGTGTDADDLSLLFNDDLDTDHGMLLLDALCGVESHDGDSSGDDESDDGDGLQPKKKRARRSRHELNEIEKQRTRRINEQIQSLRTLLEASGINGKRDKYSVLRNTTNYVQKLKALLNKTQAQLQAVLQKRKQGPQDGASVDCKEATATVQQPAAQQPTALVGEDGAGQSDAAAPTTLPGGPYQGPMIQRPPIAPGSVLETGVWCPNKNSMDHLIMFKNASIAMAVANLDGKFVDCNVAFEYISGYNNDEVLKRSVFDLTPPEDCQELMSIVGKMMENPAESAKHFWKRCCFSSRDCHCFVSMWLVRKSSGEPCFFQCAVLPLEDYPSSQKSLQYDSSHVEGVAAIEAGREAIGVNSMLHAANTASSMLQQSQQREPVRAAYPTQHHQQQQQHRAMGTGRE